MKKLFLAVFALALAACASTPDTTAKSSNSQPEKAYRTGSNIPIK